MKKLAGAALLICTCAGLVFAQTQAPSGAAPAQGPSVSQVIQQLEHDWADAIKGADTDKLGAILADDWAGISASGKQETKQGLLAGLKSSKTTVRSIEFGPMNVKVLGNVAVAQGSDTVKSTTNGKDSSAIYVWTDVFVKRDGKWVAVRSQTAPVK